MPVTPSSQKNLHGLFGQSPKQYEKTAFACLRYSEKTPLWRHCHITEPALEIMQENAPGSATGNFEIL